MLFAAILASALAQTPTITPTEAHTGKSGTTIFITAPATGSVVTAPTLHIDGYTRPLIPGPISPKFWVFSINNNGLPFQLGSSSTLSLEAPAGWVAGASILNLPVRNCVGKPEYDVQPPTMGIGLNMGSAPLPAGVHAFVGRNWLQRARWDSNTLTTGPDGLPSSLKPGAASTSALITGAATSDSIGGVLPNPSGVWYVVYDDLDGYSQASLSAADYTGNWIVAPRYDLQQNGDLRHALIRAYQVSPGRPGGSPNPTLQVTISVQSGRPPTVKNLWVLPPGNDPSDRSNPYALDAWVQRALDLGGKGPLFLRWMDSVNAVYGGESQVVNPEDLSPATGVWGQNFQTRKTATITQIRPLDLSVSPNVIAGGNSYPIPSIARVWGTGGGNYAAEFVTTTPHGFASGYGVNCWFDGTVTFTVGGKSVSITSWSNQIWVTGPTTFVMTRAGAPAGSHTIDAAVTVPATAHANGPIYAASLPVEFAANATSQFPGTALWLNVPALITDAGADALFSRALAQLGPKNRLIVEYSNEVWNWGFSQTSYCWTMSALQDLPVPGGTPVGWYVERGYQLAQRARAIFAAANRPNDVLWCIAGPAYDLGGRLGYASSKGYKCDVTSFAAYIDFPGRGTNVRDWGAITASYRADQMHDVLRHYLRLDPEAIAQYQPALAAIAKYEAAMGQRTLRYTYESAIERMIPLGAPNQIQRSWDAMFRADAADTERARWAMLQAAGVDGDGYFNLLGAMNGNGATWSLLQWQDQPWGTGEGNVPVGYDGKWHTNQSTRWQAVRDWQVRYWLGGGPDGGSAPLPTQPQQTTSLRKAG